MILELAQSISESGFEPTIGVIENKSGSFVELAKAAKSMDLNVEVFKCKGPLDPRTIRGIRNLLRVNKVDIIHAHGYKANFYALSSSRF